CRKLPVHRAVAGERAVWSNARVLRLADRRRARPLTSRLGGTLPPSRVRVLDAAPGERRQSRPLIAVALSMISRIEDAHCSAVFRSSKVIVNAADRPSCWIVNPGVGINPDSMSIFASLPPLHIM